MFLLVSGFPHSCVDFSWDYLPNKLKSESEIVLSCLTLCNSMDCLPGCSVHGILQARILEWVAISFSRDLPVSGIEPGSPALQADSLLSEPLRKLPKKLIALKSLTQSLLLGIPQTQTQTKILLLSMVR